MREIIIFVEKHTPRLAYIFDFILRELGGYRDFWLTEDLAAFSSAHQRQQRAGWERMRSGEQLPVALYYAQQPPAPPLSDALIYLPAASTLLFEEDIRAQDEGALQLDPLAWAFYLLSRYEEYLAFAADKHGRFTADLSAAARGGFLHKPIVDEFAIQLLRQLSACIGDGKADILARSYSFLPTFDIDFMYAYAHKGALRTLGGLGRDLFRGATDKAKERFGVWRGVLNDPYDNIELIRQMHAETAAPAPLFFILSALENSEYDRNTLPSSAPFADFLRRLQSVFPNSVGLHPSYAAATDSPAIAAERAALAKAANADILRSRQHFLRLRLPDTYRALLSAGLREDYTMGYAEQIGFRASTARAHYWFDLRANAITALRITPFMAMDVTLKDYLGLSANEVVGAVRPLIENCRATGGGFSLLWHNSSLASLDGWGEAWREAYRAILAEAIRG